MPRLPAVHCSFAVPNTNHTARTWRVFAMLAAADDLVVRQGNLGSELYFIAKGDLEVCARVCLCVSVSVRCDALSLVCPERCSRFITVYQA
jgi:hypothetical protein